MSASDTYLDFLAALRLDDEGETEDRDMGTLMFAAVNPVMFVLTEEIWPLYVEWYKQIYASSGAIIMDAYQDEALIELTDMAAVMARIARAGK